MIGQEKEERIKEHRENCKYLCEPQDKLEFFINLYLKGCARIWLECSSNKSNEEECVKGCINHNGHWLRKCNPHQSRIDLSILNACSLDLATSGLTLESLRKSKGEDLCFEDLYDEVETICRRSGFQNICVYDTALRYAYLLSRREDGLIDKEVSEQLMPQKYVYLHCSSLKGARILWKIDNLMTIYKKDRRFGIKPFDGKSKTVPFPLKVKRMEIRHFSQCLQNLGAVQLEDFLCVFHSILKGYYFDIAETLCRE